MFGLFESLDAGKPAGAPPPGAAGPGFLTTSAALASPLSEADIKRVVSLARQGRPAEQNLLGLLFQHGHGVNRDYQEAARWFREAINHDYIDAVHNLGVMLYQGLGADRDYEAALRYFKVASDHGHAESACHIGMMYEYGQSLDQSYPSAVEWYLLAANRGSSQAQYFLGALYFQGDGLIQDPVEAYKWFAVSAAQNDPNGIECRDIVLAQLTAEQVDEGNRRAAEILSQLSSR